MNAEPERACIPTNAVSLHDYALDDVSRTDDFTSPWLLATVAP